MGNVSQMAYRINGAYKSPARALKRRLGLWCLVMAMPASVAFGQADDSARSQTLAAPPALADALAGDAASGETGFSAESSVASGGSESFAEFIEEVESESAPVEANQDAASQAPLTGKSRLKVGMSLEEALKVLGKDPDSQSEIGAACGKFDVLTWDEDGTRLISVDGTISSVYDGKQKPQE